MTQKECNNLIGNSLEALLKPLGFKLKKLDQCFVRSDNNYSYKIGWANVIKEHKFKISFYIALREAKIENIKNKFLGVNPNFQEQTVTITLPLSFFMEENFINSNPTFSVSTETDIDKIVENLSIFLDKYIEEFFIKNSSMRALSNLMDGLITKDSIYGDTLSFYSGSIILLKLINHPLYKEKLQFYEIRLKNLHPILKEKFYQIVSYLDN